MTYNPYEHHLGFVPENCCSSQLVLYHASLWRESCIFIEVTFYIVSSPLSVVGMDFPKKVCRGERGISFFLAER